MIFSEVFEGSNSIDKLFEIKFSVSVQIHSPNYSRDQVITGQNGTLNQKSLQINLINISVIPVINAFKQQIKTVIVATG